jgi:hypothetical protein
MARAVDAGKPVASPDQYSMLAEMIRSDQMTHAQVLQFMADNPDFAAWYRRQFI